MQWNWNPFWNLGRMEMKLTSTKRKFCGIGSMSTEKDFKTISILFPDVYNGAKLQIDKRIV